MDDLAQCLTRDDRAARTEAAWIACRCLTHAASCEPRKDYVKTFEELWGVARHVFKVPGPGPFQECLRSHGWTLAGHLPGFALYRRGDVELDVPISPELADYARRATEALEVVAAVENIDLGVLLDKIERMPASEEREAEDELDALFPQLANEEGRRLIAEAERALELREFAILAASECSAGCRASRVYDRDRRELRRLRAARDDLKRRVDVLESRLARARQCARLLLGLRNEDGEIWIDDIESASRAAAQIKQAEADLFRALCVHAEEDGHG